MKKSKKARYDSWVRIGEPLTPKQQAILSIILNRYAEGLTTKRELYRAVEYFGLRGMLESDVPY